MSRPSPPAWHSYVMIALTGLMTLTTAGIVTFASNVSAIPGMQIQIESLKTEQDKLSGKIDTINESRFTGDDAERMERRINNRIDRLEDRN